MAGRWLRRGAALIVLATLLSTLGSIMAQAQGADDLAALRGQVSRLHSQGKYAEAVPLAERYVALARQTHGEEHTEFVTAIRWLAELYGAQGRYAEAEPLVKRALAITEKALGPDHTDVGTSLNNLAALYHRQGRYTEAEPLFKRTVAIFEKALGPDHPNVGGSLNNLAELYRAQGRYAEAEPLFKRTVSIDERALGPDHPDVGISLNNLALLYRGQGRYAEAEPLFKRSLAITEKALGAEHPRVGTSLDNLVLLYRDQGRYAEAEPLFKRSLAITEKALGPDHTDVGSSLSGLAGLYYSQGRYAEAEPLFKRSLAITEKALGPDHTDVGTSLNNLALLYERQGRYAEAEPLHKRALAIAEKAVGPDHPYVASSLGGLASLYERQGRYAEAEPLFERSLAITDKALGAEHPWVGSSLNNLAGLYESQGRYAEAEPLYKRALAIREKALGPDHPDVGQSLNNLAGLYWAQGRYAEAEPLYKRSLAIVEKALGPDHPDVGQSLNNLARLYFVQRDWARAADFWRRSTGVTVRRAQRGTDDVGQVLTGKTKGEAERDSVRFLGLVKVVHRLASDGRSADASLVREVFQTAQWASASEAAASLAQMAVRGAKGDPALAALVRDRQDMVGEWQKRDQARSAAVSQTPDKRDRAAEGTNVARLAAIDAHIAEIDRRLAADFPDYAALARPQPLGVEQVQAELRADEVLVLFLDTPEREPTPEETFIWVVTKADSRWVRSDLGTPSLRQEVAALRCGLDHALWKGGEAQDRCVEMLNNKYSYQLYVDGEAVDVLPFDLERAHALYKALLGPVEDLIKDKHLMVVPSGPLTSLPFSVLITKPPRARMVTTLAEHRDVAWLATRQPITVLPSVASLKSLRQFAKAGRASKLYLGIGNPLLEGPQDDPQWGEYFRLQAAAARDKQRCAGRPASLQIASTRGQRHAVASFTRVSRRGQADIEEVRRCTPLPETADELCEVARRLGVPESEILLGADATETRLKQLSEQGQLADYAILHFATHGALTGQVQGAAEPGLILTPPANGTQDAKVLERDDGFLTASEIAALKLDADWVILSACNTAGAQDENAEALSGLARAFFYAGARALVVSHWEVGSGAAVKLATRAIAELNANPRLGRAEAFRLSMRELIEKGTAFDAHPSQWAPFVVVGEGAAAR